MSEISSGGLRMKMLSPAKRIELARNLWGWQPHPSQREWMLDRHPVKVAACGRRWGKTEAAAVDIATYAIASEGTVQMIVAPTYDQSKLIAGTVERLLLSGSVTRSHTQVTKTPYPDIRYRKSRIMARTADDDGRNLRGHSADRVVVDEAAFVRDQVIEEVIGPMLADRNGSLVMVSTPFGKNHFYRAFTRGMPGDGRHRSFRFPSWTNPHISAEYIEGQRSVLTERQFKIEYEAEFVDDQNSVFPWEDIEAAVAGASILHAGEGSIYVAGVDWARYSDYTAVVVLEICAGDAGSPPYRVVEVDRFNRMEWHSQVERVADLVSKYQISGLAADQTSTGDPVLEILRNSLWAGRQLDTDIEGVVFTSQSKRELIDNLAIRLAHHEVVLPSYEPLIRELQFYEYELTESGNVRTGARRGYHDDCVCALALALRIAAKYRWSGRLLASGRLRDTARGW